LQSEAGLAYKFYYPKSSAVIKPLFVFNAIELDVVVPSGQHTLFGFAGAVPTAGVKFKQQELDPMQSV
jgi:hypothetical protein